eukprot:363655-Chlamydomonas_euryale.AAC.3
MEQYGPYCATLRERGTSGGNFGVATLPRPPLETRVKRQLTLKLGHLGQRGGELRRPLQSKLSYAASCRRCRCGSAACARARACNDLPHHAGDEEICI